MTKPATQASEKSLEGLLSPTTKASKTPENGLKKPIQNNKILNKNDLATRQKALELGNEIALRSLLFSGVYIIATVFCMFAVMFLMTAPARYNAREENIRIILEDGLLIKSANIKISAEQPKLPEAKSPQPKPKGTNVLVYDGKRKYITWPDPPKKDDLASVARYIMHISEFGSLATNSTHKGIEGYPFVNIFSISDGPVDNATGVPYFYFTPLELSVIDMEVNNKVSLTLTEAQSDYCNKNGFDPEDPRCAHVIFTGIMEKIEKGSVEEQFARNSLFSRHVEMPTWPSGHAWFFAKIKIQHIYLLDFFGGAKIVDVEDYYNANPFGKKKD